MGKTSKSWIRRKRRTKKQQLAHSEQSNRIHGIRLRFRNLAKATRRQDSKQHEEFN